MDFLYQALGEGWKLWLIIAIIFFMAEGVNAGTFALFFGGVGALATAAACCVFPAVAESGMFQLLLFAAMSISSLLLLRPAILRFTQSGEKLGGPDACVGKHAKALTVLNKDGGRVLFDGTEWAAERAEDCVDEISPGSVVEVIKMDGLTLLVKPIK